MKLRPYQKKAILATHRCLQNSDDNPVIAMPTGTGKSLVIGGLIRLTLSTPGKRVLVLAHVKELLEQNRRQTLAFDPSLNTGVYSAGLGLRQVNADVIFAGIASVYKRPKELGFFDLVLIDECHLVSDQEFTVYQVLLKELIKINPSLRVVGLTATPWRTKTGLLTKGKLFDCVCYDLTSINEYNQLVSDGYLAPLIARAMDEAFNTDSVKVSRGDFVTRELQKKVDIKKLTKLAVAEAVREAGDRKHWLVFATGIKHCEHVAEELNAQGIPASFVHSKITTEERDSRLVAFKKGELKALVNNNVLTTGFDFPGIDLIAMLRPTMSVRLWVQMLGRGSRPAPGKANCLVLDFTSNTQRLGPINNVQIPEPGKKRGKGLAPVKVCEVCKTINHAAATCCCECGADFPRKPYITATAAGLDVVDNGKPRLLRAKVDDVRYSKHEKKSGGIPSLKVTYRCGLKFYREWVCLEHSGYARHKAEGWWAEHTEVDVPDTVDEALTLIDNFEVTAEITVDMAGRYPSVISREFVPF